VAAHRLERAEPGRAGDRVAAVGAAETADVHRVQQLGPAAELFTPGTHGTTFGGNPVACAAGLAVIRTIAGEGLLDHVKRIGEQLRRGIEGLRHPLVAGVRGAGLLLGVVLNRPEAPRLVAALQEAGFLVNAAQPDVIRLAPPLIVSAGQADALISALDGIR
jgi:acetylornithine aminotransferase